MKKLLLITFIFLAACQKPPYQDPEIKQVADTVLLEAEKRGKSYSINWIGLKFSDLGAGTAGICRVSTKEMTIYIDRNFWNLKKEYREQLVAHELGHCLLNKKHNNSITNEYIPKSIMYTYVIDNQIYQFYKKYYFDELFN